MKKESIRSALNLAVQKYSEEISRKDRIEAKAIGYYTVLGITLAAFLVIYPFWLEKQFRWSCDIHGILSAIMIVLLVGFLTVLTIAFINIHNVYKPKNRAEITPEQYWNEANSEISEKTYLETVYNHVVETTQKNEEINNQLVLKAVTINNLILTLMIISVSICVLVFIAWIIK
ncbi:hypothetical protein [Alkalispirochaeta alkalica]|uniref:hypothetical protein n=1 Tax=Alkalispirochaeta alkalica TaxID=46356 RepID=UPI000370587F|nr:hypothetical protein [Alkalispirochaeta alkalica]